MNQQSKYEDPRPTRELIRVALTEQDEHAAWEPVTILHFRGTREVLEEAQKLCSSQDSRERCLGANILGQLGVPERAFPEECFHVLEEMLGRESDPGVLSSIGVAFCHLRDPRAIDHLIPFKSHPQAEVRLGVVHGLSCHEHDSAISALIELSTDDDTEVRDWATFALGSQTDADRPDLRDALLARTTDVDFETRGEALVGLAERKDPRVIEPVMKELTSSRVGYLALEAAAAIGDPVLLPALLDLKARWGTKEDPDAERLHEELEKAILRCKRE